MQVMLYSVYYGQAMHGITAAAQRLLFDEVKV
jgi:hypothetical protein